MRLLPSIPLWLRRVATIVMVSALTVISVSAAHQAQAQLSIALPLQNHLMSALPRSVHPPHTHIIWMEVTAYCPCHKCCGPKAAGLTASGKRVTYNDGRF